MRDLTIEATIVAGSLCLSDGGYTKADHGASIFWVIRDNGYHPSIVSIVEKPGSTNIFSVSPHAIGATPAYCSRWLGVIDRTVPYDSEYIYSILVKDDRGSYPLDPKIAVKPAPLTIETLIRKAEKNKYLLVAAILSLLFLQILRKKKK